MLCCPPGGPAGQSYRRKVRRACPSGGPAGQSYRRNVRRACPSGGPAGRSTKKGFRCNMLRCNSLYPVQETGETLARECATPPARSQSARVTGDLSARMRRASGALTVCTQCVSPRSASVPVPYCDGLRDQNSFRKGRAAPPARSQSARVTGDLSARMRRASGALTVCTQCVSPRSASVPVPYCDGLRDQNSFRKGRAAPPARSQSARVTGDLSGSMRRASGALKGCAQRVKRRECKCWQSW